MVDQLWVSSDCTVMEDFLLLLPLLPAAGLLILHPFVSTPSSHAHFRHLPGLRCPPVCQEPPCGCRSLVTLVVLVPGSGPAQMVYLLIVAESGEYGDPPDH